MGEITDNIILYTVPILVLVIAIVIAIVIGFSVFSILGTPENGITGSSMSGCTSNVSPLSYSVPLLVIIPICIMLGYILYYFREGEDVSQLKQTSSVQPMVEDKMIEITYIDAPCEEYVYDLKSVRAKYIQSYKNIGYTSRMIKANQIINIRGEFNEQ